VKEAGQNIGVCCWMKEIFSTRTVEEDEPLSIADLLNALSTSALVFCRFEFI
jgi:hypothetical protein